MKMASSSKSLNNGASSSGTQLNPDMQTRAPVEVQAHRAKNGGPYVFPHRPNRPAHLPQIKGPLPPDIIVDPQGLFFCFVCRTHVPGGTPNLTQHLQGKRHAFSDRQFKSAAQKEDVRQGFLEAAAAARLRDRQRDTSRVRKNIPVDGKEKCNNTLREPESCVVGPSRSLLTEASSTRGPSPPLLSSTTTHVANVASGSSTTGQEIEGRVACHQSKTHLSRQNVANLQELNRRDRGTMFQSPLARSVSRSEERALRHVSVLRRSPVDKMDIVQSEDEEVPVPCDGNCVRMKHLADYLKTDSGKNSGVLLTRQQVYEGHEDHLIGRSTSSRINLGVQGTPSRVCKTRTDSTQSSRYRLTQTASRSRIICRFAPPLFHAAARGDFASRRSGLASAMMPGGQRMRNPQGIYKAGLHHEAPRR